MCGIVGKICWRPDPRALDPLEQMLALIRHRGPDQAGVHRVVAADCAVGLAHARLSIIDLSPWAGQPMGTEDGAVWIVYNGEIYNFGALRERLSRRGHRFRTRSDTEVVLRGYLEWGAEVLHRLEGMFAFAVWDGPRRRLLCARDPLGIKPLYWCVRGDCVWFASEIKGMLGDPALPREVDQQGLVHYLTFGHGIAPATMFRHVRKLPPGHLLTVEEGGVRMERYWDLPIHPDPKAAEAGVVREARERLEAAVRSHMVADVPVGAFLSGGLDSSAVVALMARHAGEPVHTYSVGFAEPGYDERWAAREVAAHIGTVHREVVVDARTFRESLAPVAWHYDEPFADAAAVPLYLLSRLARHEVKVVLTGEGSDELFGGYRRASVERIAPLYGTLPGSVRRLIAGAAHRLPRLRRVKQALAALALDEPAERYAAWLTIFDAAMRAEATGAAPGDPDPLAAFRQYCRADLDPVTRALYCDLKLWLPDTYLEKVDKATMAWGLEARVPFLDHQLVRFAFRVRPALKIRGLVTKYALKRAARDLLPAVTVGRKKQGFAVPTDPWFRGPLRELVQSVIADPVTTGRGLLRRDYLERLAREHWQGRQVRDRHLYLVIMLELWCRIYLDGRPGPIAL